MLVWIIDSYDRLYNYIMETIIWQSRVQPTNVNSSRVFWLVGAWPHSKLRIGARSWFVHRACNSASNSYESRFWFARMHLEWMQLSCEPCHFGCATSGSAYACSVEKHGSLADGLKLPIGGIHDLSIVRIPSFQHLLSSFLPCAFGIFRVL